MAYWRRHHPRASERAFTLIELLVVIALIAILAAILFPVFARAKDKAKQATCLNELKQVGMALAMYLDSDDGCLPDRRDLKLALPGGYKPWNSWPASDPRAGWAAIVLQPYTKNMEIWSCPGSAGVFADVVQVMQPINADPKSPKTTFWMWRFDRTDDPVPLDNLWGKTEDQAVSDLQQAGNPQAGYPEGVADVEIAVDPYFPKTINSVEERLKGKAAHFGGRNRLFLDTHAKFLKDHRTDR